MMDTRFLFKRKFKNERIKIHTFFQNRECFIDSQYESSKYYMNVLIKYDVHIIYDELMQDS